MNCIQLVMLAAGTLGLFRDANGGQILPEVSQTKTTLILLGTAGGPGGSPERAGIASLVDIDGYLYLVDAGEGVSRQLARAGFSETDIRIVFITHLHDDHTSGLPALMSFGYTQQTLGMEIIGPPRTVEFVESALAFLQANAEIRMAERRLNSPSDVIKGRSAGTGLVYSDERIKVTAVVNTHFHLAKDLPAARNKSYSYRFETPDEVIVFTGDTGPSESVEDLAREADILVAEMVSGADIARVPHDVVEHMLSEHLSPSEVGKLAARAGVGTLVLSHIRHAAEQDVAEIRTQFDGKIVLGSDLDRF